MDFPALCTGQRRAWRLETEKLPPFCFVIPSYHKPERSTASRRASTAAAQQDFHVLPLRQITELLGRKQK